MAIADYALPFGMREIELTPFTDGAATTYGTAVKLPVSRTMSWSDSESFTDLRGGDAVVASRGSGPDVEWELEAGGIDLEAYAIIAGGTVTSTGVTPNVVKTYSKTAASSRPYFKAEGRAISDNGGDFHAVLYKCKATGSIDGELTDGEFLVTSCSGKCFPSTVVADVDKIYDFVHNETAVAL